ncbi:histidine phosphatase family protein [Microlunatus speluncae]|uniref:histidine phosphatase family protein n=1 Tax=Microlunatus speluncae TaxID=2594267 RepID=UPI0012665B47|nr:histidine phosphatase family protein [Microlunatus speluncae]
MPRRVTLIRHAAPMTSADVDPAEWRLSPAGRRAATALGPRIPEPAALASSTELKAVETLSFATGRAAAELHLDRRFGEVVRPGEPYDDDHRSRRLAWVEGRPDDRHRTWESLAQAAARFQAGLDDFDGDVVVATHGMVLTAWLVSRGVVRPGAEAGDFWTRLAFPDLINTDL